MYISHTARVPDKSREAFANISEGVSVAQRILAQHKERSEKNEKIIFLLWLSQIDSVARDIVEV